MENNFSKSARLKNGLALSSVAVVAVSVRAILPLLRERVRRRKAALSHARSNDVTACEFLGVIDGTWTCWHWCAFQGHVWLLQLIACFGRRSIDDKCTQGAWTPLHCAATTGKLGAAELLLREGASIDNVDASNNTALMIATAKGHVVIARALLAGGASPNMANARGHSPLHIAAASASNDMVVMLLENRALPDASDNDGSTPLLVAAARQARWQACWTLLSHGAQVDVQTHASRQTPLMLVAAQSHEQAEKLTRDLISHKADMSAVDRFGSTALHVACRKGRPGVIAALCVNRSIPCAQDDDGFYPLQLLVERCAEEPGCSELVDIGMDAIIKACPDVTQFLDYGDMSALHNLCLHAGLKRTAPLRAIKALLSASADPCVEEAGGWSPVHFASQAGGVAAESMLSALQQFSSTNLDFWKNIDFQKKRDLSNRKYLARRGGHNRIPLEVRSAVLKGDATIHRIGKLLQTGECGRVVVLLGAGASTAAGIPDYRSKSAAEVGNQSWTAARFAERPEEFWLQKGSAFLDCQPTKLHRFLASLAQRGKLLRVYTQNVDGLEVSAGVPSELVVNCHGSLRRCVCSNDRTHRTGVNSLDEILEHTLASGKAPLCTTCRALIRPDVVFFGESLPVGFSRMAAKDLWDCDLLIVAGTNLVVYPVAGLVNQVRPTVPRLLINRERVGPWRTSATFGGGSAFRDVMYEGFCDDGADILAKHLDGKSE